jgi:hypothetical protein
MWFAAWLVANIITGLCSFSAWSTIRDANEEGLPLERRPSWMMFVPREALWVTLREHRRRYPERNTIRRWAVVALFLQGAVLFLPLLWWRVFD